MNKYRYIKTIKKIKTTVCYYQHRYKWDNSIIICKLQKRCTRLAAESDQVYQLFAHDRWFSPGIPASSTTKTGRHDIAEILLKVALNTTNQIKSNQINNMTKHFNFHICELHCHLQQIQ